jgi:2-methylisocitrate lyase-like PEP mutase family enzyme
VASPFAALHRPGQPFLLPNAWDVVSAALLVDAGFPAVGTTSLGVAASAGLPDAAGATRDQTLVLARRLARLPALVTVDIEAGFSDDPGQVAALVAELHDYGVVGINIEDGRGDTLAPVDVQTRLIATVRSAVPDIFINARTDAYWLHLDRPFPETLTRVVAYRDAGADGVFVPGVRDPAEIEAVVRVADRPVNLLADRPLPELAALGVARVSCGSLLYRHAVHTAMAVARALAAGQAPPTAGPSYADVTRLLGTAD